MRSHVPTKRIKRQEALHFREEEEVLLPEENCKSFHHIYMNKACQQSSWQALLFELFYKRLFHSL